MPASGCLAVGTLAGGLCQSQPPGSLSLTFSSGRLLIYRQKDLASCPHWAMGFLCGQVVPWHGVRTLCCCSSDLDPRSLSGCFQPTVCSGHCSLVSVVRKEKTEQAETRLSSGCPCEGHRRQRYLAEVCSALGWDWRWGPRALTMVLTALSGLPPPNSPRLLSLTHTYLRG